MHAFKRALAIEQFEALKTVEDLIGLIEAEISEGRAADSRLSRLMLEAMREAERDPALRHRLAGTLAGHRRTMVEIVRADQEQGAAFPTLRRKRSRRFQGRLVTAYSSMCCSNRGN
jgi:hypothetical protein